MATNSAKRLGKVEKLIDATEALNKRFHFVVLEPGETIAERIASALLAGEMRECDECQPINITWHMHPLRGAQAIPTGEGEEDIFADPRSSRNRGVGGAGASSDGLDQGAETAEHRARWAQHERKIMANGTRYQGD